MHLQGIARSQLGGIGINRFTSRSLFSPTAQLIDSLFGNGEQGAMFIPQPTVLGEQVLYQDAAGTTPVTSDGDPVGLMQDLSGNSNHASQETSAARPLYRTDGELHWLEFDGVDDHMTSGPVVLGSDIVVSASANKLADTTGAICSGNSSLSTGQPRDNFTLRFPRSSSQNGALFATISGNYPTAYEEGASAGARKDVITGAKVTAQNYLFTAGQLAAQVASEATAFTTPAIYVGGHDLGQFSGHLYGLVLRAGDLQYRVQTEQYLAQKAGVTL